MSKLEGATCAEELRIIKTVSEVQHFISVVFFFPLLFLFCAFQAVFPFFKKNLVLFLIVHVLHVFYGLLHLISNVVPTANGKYADSDGSELCVYTVKIYLRSKSPAQPSVYTFKTSLEYSSYKSINQDLIWISSIIN